MNRGRVKNSTYNILSGFAYQLTILIMSFISRTVLIRTLGLEYLGLNGIFADVLSLLSMADLGINTSLAYILYKPLAENDEERLTALVCFYKKIYRFIAITVTVLGLLAIPFLRVIINTEREIPNLVFYYLCSLSGVVLSYLFVYRTIILTADQKNYQVLRISIWTTFIKYTLQIVTLMLLKNYIIYLMIGVLIQLLNNLLILKKADRMYPFIRRYRRISQEDEKNIFSNMKSMFLYKISGTMFNATTNILISFLIGTAMVGVYSNYLMVSNKLLLIIQIVFSALTASIGNVIVQERLEKRYEIFKAMQSICLIFCGVITSVFCIMANDLVSVWLGNDFTISSMSIIAFTLITYCSCVLLPLCTYRDATGLYMKTKYIMLLAALLNIILSMIMGHLWGLTGILFASVVSKICTSFWYEPKILFHEYFKRRVSRYFLSLLYNALLIAVTILLLSWMFRDIKVDGWAMLILKGGSIGIISTGIFLGAYANTEGFRMILNIAFSVFRKLFRANAGRIND